MKRIAVIFLLFIYSTASMGATIHLHYCMNEFVEWSFTKKAANDKCSKCGMKEKKGGCCKVQEKEIKIKTDQQKAAIADFVKIIDAPSLVTPFIDYSFTTIYTALVFLATNAQPDIPIERLFILHCVFLI